MQAFYSLPETAASPAPRGASSQPRGDDVPSGSAPQDRQVTPVTASAPLACPHASLGPANAAGQPAAPPGNGIKGGGGVSTPHAAQGTAPQPVPREERLDYSSPGTRGTPRLRSLLLRRPSVGVPSFDASPPQPSPQSPPLSPQLRALLLRPQAPSPFCLEEESVNSFVDWRNSGRTSLRRVPSLGDWATIPSLCPTPAGGGGNSSGGGGAMGGAGGGEGEPPSSNVDFIRVPSFSPWATDTKGAMNAAITAVDDLGEGSSPAASAPAAAAVAAGPAGVSGLLRALLSRARPPPPVVPPVMARAASLRMAADPQCLAPDHLGPIHLGPELVPHLSPPEQPLLDCNAFPGWGDFNWAMAAPPEPAAAETPSAAPREIRVVRQMGAAEGGRVRQVSSQGSGLDTLERSRRGGSWAAAALLSASVGKLSDVGSAMDAIWSGECDSTGCSLPRRSGSAPEAGAVTLLQRSSSE